MSSTAERATTPSSTRQPPRSQPRCSVRSWHRASSRRATAMPGRRSPTNPRTSRPRWRSRTRKTTWLRSVHMSTAIDNAAAADPGLESLVMLLQFQGVAADRGQIRHGLGAVKIGAPEMLRCAKDLGLKARAYRTDWSRLVRTPLPAIASLRDGGFMLIAKASKDKVLVQSPLAPKPAMMSRAELNAIWD